MLSIYYKHVQLRIATTVLLGFTWSGLWFVFWILSRTNMIPESLYSILFYPSMLVGSLFLPNAYDVSHSVLQVVPVLLTYAYCSFLVGSTVTSFTLDVFYLSLPSLRKECHIKPVKKTRSKHVLLFSSKISRMVAMTFPATTVMLAFWIPVFIASTLKLF